MRKEPSSHVGSGAKKGNLREAMRNGDKAVMRRVCSARELPADIRTRGRMPAGPIGVMSHAVASEAAGNNLYGWRLSRFRDWYSPM
jgi:hypothetical protein